MAWAVCRVLLCNEDLDQPRVATCGGGVQRRPQLVVLSIDAGSSIQQDLHHFLVVIDTTLWGEREREREGKVFQSGYGFNTCRFG